MPKDRDTTRGTRHVFGSRDEMPAPTPGSAEGERVRRDQPRETGFGPTSTSAEGDAFPEGSDSARTKTEG